MPTTVAPTAVVVTAVVPSAWWCRADRVVARGGDDAALCREADDDERAVSRS
ncbi:hypothetical protein K1Y80_01410 [Streptomyces sp. MAG02]|nr:hypothetical protein [Streptomyces sp. MAG02]